MKDLIKQVALEGAEKFGVVADDSEIVDLVTWCVAELSKRANAVYVEGTCELQNWKWIRLPVERENEYREWGWKVRKLFNFPPINDIEAIENRVAEACIKAIKSIDDGEAPEYSHCLETLGSGEWRKYK